MYGPGGTVSGSGSLIGSGGGSVGGVSGMSSGGGGIGSESGVGGVAGPSSSVCGNRIRTWLARSVPVPAAPKDYAVQGNLGPARMRVLHRDRP